MKFGDHIGRIFLLVGVLSGVIYAGVIKIPMGAEDIFPCYKADGRTCKVVNYASSSDMPMDGELAFVGNKMDCLYADGWAYIIARSNAPEQIHDSVFWGTTSRCYDDNWNCGNLGDGVEIPRYTKKSGLYFYTCKNAVATAKGCKPVEKGLEILVTDEMKMVPMTRAALFYYFKARQKKNFNSLMEWLLKNDKMDGFFQTLPWGLKEENLIRAGNLAVPGVTELDFYLRDKKVESKSYQKGNFKSFGELMNSCKEWGKSHETP